MYEYVGFKRDINSVHLRYDKSVGSVLNAGMAQYTLDS